MGLKTSGILAAIADGGGEVLSFAESTSLEGTTFVPQKTTFDLDVPIPVGNNKLFRFRIYAMAVNAAPAGMAASYEFTLWRRFDGALNGNTTAAIYGGALPLNYSIQPNALRFTFGTGYDGYYVWKWILSPTYDLPFALPGDG